MKKKKTDYVYISLYTLSCVHHRSSLRSVVSVISVVTSVIPNYHLCQKSVKNRQAATTRQESRQAGLKPPQTEIPGLYVIVKLQSNRCIAVRCCVVAWYVSCHTAACSGAWHSSAVHLMYVQTFTPSCAVACQEGALADTTPLPEHKIFEQKWPILNQKLKKNSGEGHSTLPRPLQHSTLHGASNLAPSLLTPSPPSPFTKS